MPPHDDPEPSSSRALVRQGSAARPERLVEGLTFVPAGAMTMGEFIKD